MCQLRSITILILLVSIIAGCSKKHPSDMGPTVAKIGNEYIYLYDIISPEDSATFFQRGLEFQKKRITSYVMRDMYIREGYKKGFHKNDTVIEKMDAYTKNGMVNIVYRGEILDRFVGEKARRELYENLKKQVSGRHILIAYQGSLAPPPKITRSKTDALLLITEIGAKIKNKEDFITYADSLSEDPTSIDGGDLGFFEWGQMEDSFQEVAFSLPINTLSKAVESSYGYHLIWVDSVKSVELGSFTRMEGQLRNKLYTIKNDALVNAAESLIDSLNNLAGTVINTDRIDTLVKSIFTFIKTKSSGSLRKSPVGFLGDQMKNGPLATYYDKEVTTQVLIDLLKNPTTRWALNSLADTSLIKKIVIGEVNKAIITKLGFDSGYDKKPEFRKDFKKKEGAFVWQEMREFAITDKLNSSDGNIQKYYDEHKDNYLTKRKSDIVEILVTDKILADSLYALAQNGADMTELAVKFSNRKKVEKSMGIIKDVTRFQMGKIGKKVSTMNVDEISGPVKIGKNWSFFKVISVKEPEYRPFEDVRSKILVDFRKYEKDRHAEIFEINLTNTYKPQYYYENLDNTVAEGKVE
ncbi:peptidyl-prolyl cis-trans isomerase [Candidatus Marinimicrobia bacterium MT.SAG.4]|nr:peptidyl-prolyl cis-trans isomerase [Candidatus Marinimicrobia bacterium MT.SAG.4]